ncbi:MAG TPA: helix-turn-helix domain-containing protein [Mycobacterium sp.]|nr:helix-turn-helix domain-containing protein [Mycobacterium sp.]
MSDAALSQTCGVRRPVLWLRPAHAGYLGPELDVGMHATPIACVGLGLDGPFILETTEHGERVARTTYVAARTPHRIVTDGWIVLLFAEPATAAATVLRDSMQTTAGACRFDSRYEPDLIAAATEGVAAIDELVCALAPVPQSFDARIAQTMQEIRTDPASRTSANAAAAALNMSVSHFLHSFAERTGTTFRRYRQWARLRAVSAGLNAGHDLTRCAADAGFASPSHLSETFRRTFGLSLTSLLKAQVEFDIR